MTNERHALIVGGSRGLGWALAETWSSAGRRVSVLSRQAASLNCEKSGCTGWSADLRQPEQLRSVVARIVSTLGPIDDLVFTQRARGGQDPWGDEIATSLTGTATVMSALENSWVRQRCPSVVIVGSLAARMVAIEQHAGYHAAKAGLDALTRYYAVNLAGLGVRVNAVSPGVIRSRRTEDVMPPLTADQLAYLHAIPLKRLANPVDIVDAIDFLCGPRAQYITGQTLVVDGGLSLIMQHSLAAQMARNQLLPKSDSRESHPQTNQESLP